MFPEGTEGGWSTDEGMYNSGTSMFPEGPEATMSTDDLLMFSGEPGQFMKIKDTLVQKKFNPVKFVKCEELQGTCIYPDGVEFCNSGESIFNDGRCPDKKMVCCAPAEGGWTMFPEGTEGGWSTDEGMYNSGTSMFPEGPEATMSTDDLLMFSGEPRQFVKKENILVQKKFNPVKFVKCEELHGTCLHRDEIDFCNSGNSIDNDGKCFDKKMVCCAPVTYSSGVTTEAIMPV